MYPKSCCVLFLLVLVTCQAAPSSTTIEKSSEGETFAKTNIELESTGAEKDRTKKSATTFCVEVRAGKTEKYPCSPETKIQQELASKPLVLVQPIQAPKPSLLPSLPLLEYSQHPVVQPLPQSSQTVNVIQQPLQPQPVHQPLVLPRPVPQPLVPPTFVPIRTPAAPAPAPAPIINVIPPAPGSASCDKPAQPHIHQIHVIQETKPYKIKKPSFKPIQPLPLPTPIQLVERWRTPCTCSSDTDMLPTPLPRIWYSALPLPSTADAPNRCNEEGTRMANVPPDAATFDPVDTAFNSMPYRSSMISRPEPEYNPNIMSDQSMFASEGAKEAEERHHKKHQPVNFNVQFPIVYGTDNIPKYYQPQYYPLYSNPNFYTYPNSYNYGTYGTSYPVSYTSQDSANKPAITVNAGGPFYGRESAHIDSSSKLNNEEQPTTFSTDSQAKNEQQGIIQTDKNIKEKIFETKLQ